MERLASVFHGVSSEGRKLKEKLSQGDYEYEAQIKDVKLMIKATNEKYGNMLDEARHEIDVLVVGDPFGATTHIDHVVRAKHLGVNIEVVHNAYVMNVVRICGLHLYHYGETVSIMFFTKTWRPDNFYEKIKKNRFLGLLTLYLLDIRVKEPTFESLCRGGKKPYEPPRYMSFNTVIEQLLEVEQKHGDSVYGKDTECVGFARVGYEDQRIVAGTMKQLESLDLGASLHCLVSLDALKANKRAERSELFNLLNPLKSEHKK